MPGGYAPWEAGVTELLLWMLVTTAFFNEGEAARRRGED